MVPDVKEEMICVNRFASHFNNKWQLRPMSPIVHQVMAKKWPEMANTAENKKMVIQSSIHATQGSQVI